MDSRQQREAIVDVLTALASGLVPDVEESTLDELSPLLEQTAIDNGMGAALAHYLVEKGLACSKALRAERQRARFAMAAGLQVVRTFGECLDEAAIRWVVLKGPVIASRYDNPGERVFSDLDVLVAGGDLKATVEIMERVGIESINRNWANYLRHGVAEIPMWTPALGIDLHWHLVPLQSQRQKFDLRIDELLDRRRSVEVNGVEVSTLDPEDFLLHVALHAALSGAGRLSWLRDIRELIRKDTVDWDLLARRATEAKTAERVGHALDRARCWVGADVPTEAVAALCSPRWRVARAATDKVAFGRAIPGRILPSFPLEMADGVGGLVRGARDVVGRRLGDDDDVSWNVGDPSSLLYWDTRSGGSEGAERYFNFAAQDAR